MLVPCLEFCGSQVLDWQPGGGLGSAAGGQAPQQFVVQSLLFIHGVVRCPSYRGAASSLSLHSGARTQIEQLKGLAAEVQQAPNRVVVAAMVVMSNQAKLPRLVVKRPMPAVSRR